MASPGHGDADPVEDWTNCREFPRRPRMACQAGCSCAFVARMTAILVLACFLALPALVALVPGSAAASPEPARLSGDRVTVDLEARRARAEGNVVLTYKDLRIICDVLEVDTSSGELVATGNVEFHDGDDVVTG
ncbi:MAG: hypothetical protein QME82_05970, partial [Bacillota bacterium]|nr:hypothetical protein [Bacillota bacterium]